MDIDFGKNIEEIDQSLIKQKYKMNNNMKVRDISSEINSKKQPIEIDVLNNFSKISLDILNDIIILFNKDVNISNFGNLKYYLRELLLIFTKEKRTFYVGIFFIIISVIISFIEITK